MARWGMPGPPQFGGQPVTPHERPRRSTTGSSRTPSTLHRSNGRFDAALEIVAKGEKEDLPVEVS
jgi:hypothetical protein